MCCNKCQIWLLWISNSYATQQRCKLLAACVLFSVLQISTDSPFLQSIDAGKRHVYWWWTEWSIKLRGAATEEDSEDLWLDQRQKQEKNICQRVWLVGTGGCMLHFKRFNKTCSECKVTACSEAKTAQDSKSMFGSSKKLESMSEESHAHIFCFFFWPLASFLFTFFMLWDTELRMFVSIAI